MNSESALREKLATVTRIFAMQGMIGLFGHVSAFDSVTRRVFMSPGMAGDKATTRPADLLVLDLQGKLLDGDGQVPVEWPIHTAIHGARSDALAVAHLHSPYATLFAIAKREFRPVTLQGALFLDGVPVYSEPQLVKTTSEAQRLSGLIGGRRAALLRGHGIVVLGKDIEEMLFASLILEDDTRKAMQAATLGKLGFISPEECRAFATEADWERRAHRAWNYFTRLEARWDRQPATGAGSLA
ncbi:MAG: class II aldolase/adducin family protein [Deltaproteobacteria bacterium]|nr:class II aldolase/adducin family protein [Deltaproteobacteria bacterium]